MARYLRKKEIEDYFMLLFENRPDLGSWAGEGQEGKNLSLSAQEPSSSPPVGGSE